MCNFAEATLFSSFFSPCPGQCNLARVCKSEEAFWGLDWIFYLHRKLSPNTQPNLAHAAGMELQTYLLHIWLYWLVCHQMKVWKQTLQWSFSSWVLMLCIVSTLPLRSQNSLGNSFVKNFIEMQTDINVDKMKETLSNFCEWAFKGLLL